MALSWSTFRRRHPNKITFIVAVRAKRTNVARTCSEFRQVSVESTVSTGVLFSIIRAFKSSGTEVTGEEVVEGMVVDVKGEVVLRMAVRSGMGVVEEEVSFEVLEFRCIFRWWLNFVFSFDFFLGVCRDGNSGFLSRLFSKSVHVSRLDLVQVLGVTPKMELMLEASCVCSVVRPAL